MLGFGYCLMVSWLFCVLCFTSSLSLTGFYTEDEPPSYPVAVRSYVATLLQELICSLLIVVVQSLSWPTCNSVVDCKRLNKKISMIIQLFADTSSIHGSQK